MLHDRIEVPDGDLLIHCGDGLLRGDETEFSNFADWYTELPHKKKFYVPGNHDGFIQENLTLSRTALPNTQLLVDEGVTVEGIKFWGSPWTPKFRSWWFMKTEHELGKIWNSIPTDTDIIITHGPAYNFRDRLETIKHVGSESLRKRVFDVKPKFHLFGHIHESYGQEVCQGINFINASCCNASYSPVNPPVVLEL
jgi:Icc-related predicted phosphoesterase